jgi:hypothetical protein
MNYRGAINITEAKEEFELIKPKVKLTLDNPASVKIQIKKIILAQKELRLLKKRLTATISDINSKAAQTNTKKPEYFFLFKLDNGLSRREIEAEKKKARQPYIQLKSEIENVILEGDKLKIMAREYCLEMESK